MPFLDQVLTLLPVSYTHLSGVGVDKNLLENTIYELILQECTLDQCLIKDVFENLDLLPSNVNLSGAEIELIGVQDKEYILKNSIEERCV